MSSSAWFARARAAAGILHGSRTFGGPVQAGIDLSHHCNLKCIHCYFFSPVVTTPNTRERRRVTLGDAAAADAPTTVPPIDVDPVMEHRLIDELLRMGTRRFQFTGNGEAFTHPQALDFMRQAKEGGAFCFSNTNGTLLRPAVIDALLDMGFDELRVTVMAGTADGYVRTHPGVRASMFDQLRDSLRYIAEQKQRLRLKKPCVKLVTIVVKQNHDELLSFARLAEDVRADGVLIKPVDDVGDPGLLAVVPSDEESIVVRRQVEEARGMLERAGIRHNADHFLSVFQRRLDTAELYRSIPCVYGWLSTLIEADGTVYPCCRCYDTLGNAFDSGFAAIWEGAAYREFRRQAISLPRGTTAVKGCSCERCVHHEANIKAYGMMHPWARRRLRNLAVSRGGGDGE